MLILSTEGDQRGGTNKYSFALPHKTEYNVAILRGTSAGISD